MSNSVSAADHRAALEKFNHYVNLAREIYDVDMSHVKMTYNIRGHRIAGRAHYSKGEVQLNPKYFGTSEARDHLLNVTVGHEVAHWVDMLVYDGRGHGSSWKRVMRSLGLEPERCHDVSIEDLGYKRRERKTVEYKCACTTHHITTKRHGMITRGRSYSCRDCGETIRPASSVNVPQAIARPVPRKVSQPVRRPVAGGTKKDQARAIFHEMSGVHTRASIIGAFCSQLEMTKAGASTYYANFNSGRW